MFGYRYLKARATDHVFVYSGGRLRRQGLGLSGFVFAPFATAAAVPTDARDDVFAVEAISADYQVLTIQGLISHRIADPAAAVARQDFSIDLSTARPNAEPMKQIAERLQAIAQTAARESLSKVTLDAALNRSDELGRTIVDSVRADAGVAAAGIAVERVLVLSIRPAPEIRKALEASLREQLLRQADAAVFERRRAAANDEHDLQMRNEANARRLAESELANAQALEIERKKLAEQRAATVAAEAESEAAAQRLRLAPWTEVSNGTIAALALRDWASRDTSLSSLSIASDAIERIADALADGAATAKAPPVDRA